MAETTHLNPSVFTISPPGGFAGQLGTVLGKPTDEPDVPAAPPDPSRVYGYVALVDPGSGQLHLVHDVDNPVMTLGYPHQFTVLFRSVDGATQAGCSFGAGCLEVVRRPGGELDYEPANNGGFAWYYDIQLNADRSEGAPRLGGPNDLAHGPLRTGVVSYNPDQWRFESISVDFVDIPDPNGLTMTSIRCDRVPFAARDEPFPELPDTAG